MWDKVHKLIATKKFAVIAIYAWATVVGIGFVYANSNLTPTSNGVCVGVFPCTSGVSFDMSGVTDSMLNPQGTTAQRPSSPVNGMIRENTDTGWLEVYGGGKWNSQQPAPSPSQASATHTFVTATNQTGFQISSTRNTWVSYSVLISTTATIAGGSGGTVFLEIAATNSTTPGDWTTITQVSNSQTLTLAITLQSVQPNGLDMFGFIPAGYYVRLRSAITAGSPTFSYLAGQEVLN